MMKSPHILLHANRSAKAIPKRSFYNSRLLHNAQQNSQQDQKQRQSESKKEKREAEDNTVEGRSPFAAFMEVLRVEVRKNREFQESVKQLGGEVDSVRDSEAMRKTREVYERARLMASIKENPKLRAAAEELKKAGASVNDAVTQTLKTMDENEFIRGGREAVSKAATAVSDAALTASAPIRNTETYKAVASEISQAIEDAAMDVQHGGYLARDQRRRRWEERRRKAGLVVKGKKRMAENVNAGQAVELHATANIEKPSRMPQGLRTLLDNMSESYHASENPFIETTRSVTSTIGRFFAETETAKVVRLIRESDPSFSMEAFVKELREFIAPEVVDAVVEIDQAALKEWCSEGTFNVQMASLQPFVRPDLINESKVLDLRNVDIAKVKLLDHTTPELPVLVVSFQTQEIHCFRDHKTKEIKVGDESRILDVRYVAVLAREEEVARNTGESAKEEEVREEGVEGEESEGQEKPKEINPEEKKESVPKEPKPEEPKESLTGGWKIIDMARQVAN